MTTSGDNRARAGFLMRLVRDRRGNTLAMMAAFLIPLLGLAGSAVDVARLYVVKARLQQACDAGVLAGRKFMTSTNNTLDPTAVTQAQNFFSNNFKTGWMGSTDVAFTPTKTSDSQVAGTASTTVPMTLMKIFNMPDKAIAVNCQPGTTLPTPMSCLCWIRRAQWRAYRAAPTPAGPAHIPIRARQAAACRAMPAARAMP